MRLIFMFLITTLLSLHAETSMVKDPRTNLLWEDTMHVKIKATHTQARTYCSNLTLGKFTNWRLPTLSELLSIVDYTRYEPAILKEFSQSEKESLYWSSTPYAKDSDKYWGVHSGDGSSSGATEYYDRYVRCVRDLK
jgi:hypothetical protein